MTTPEKLSKMDFDVEVISHALSNLSDRWQDEKEYENWDDYVKAAATLLPAGATDPVLTQRPFLFTFATADGYRHRFRVTSRTVEYDVLEPLEKLREREHAAYAKLRERYPALPALGTKLGPPGFAIVGSALGQVIIENDKGKRYNAPPEYVLKVMKPTDETL